MENGKKLKTSIRRLKEIRSLFTRYYLRIAAMVAGALIFMGFLLTVVISVQWWNDRVDQLKANAQELASYITEKHGTVEDSELREDLSAKLAAFAKATGSDYFITDSEGRAQICPHSGNGHSAECGCEEHSKLTMDEEHMTRALKDGFSEYNAVSDMGYGVFLLAVPIREDGESTGAVYAVEDAVSGLVPYVLSILEAAFIITVVSLIVCFFVIFFICRGITEPISEMSEATRHFAKGEFKFRAREDYRESYLNRFGSSLNKMADALAIENESQKSFVANVSHELKTPMTSIGGFVDAIRDGTIPPEKQEEYLEIVSNEVKRLSRMVQAMLNLSRIESGEVGLSPISYNISEQIFNTLLTFEKIIEDKHVTIEGFEDIKPVVINGDKDLLQQVIYNLIDNAVKFVDDGGTITVFCRKKDDGAWICIRNTGKTVPNDEISRIFERFYKVDKSRSFDRKGVGLGLYIVKTIVNMHDGEITASSKEGEYTQFEFTLPGKSE